MGKIYLAALIFVVGGCAGMETALSQMNQEMGAQCAYYQMKVSVYLDGEYKVTTYYKSENSETDRRELRWLNRTQDYYLNLYKFDTWYETSPVTKAQYRFNVYCSQYY